MGVVLRCPGVEELLDCLIAPITHFGHLGGSKLHILVQRWIQSLERETYIDMTLRGLLSTAFLSAGQFQPYQGDIILTTDQEQELLGSKSVSKNDPFGPQFAVSANSRRLWRDGVMPYRFNRNLGNCNTLNTGS